MGWRPAPVGPPPKAEVARLQMSPFYAQHLSADGFPIVSSASVYPFAARGRAHGLGATHHRPTVSCGEENLLCLPGDPGKRFPWPEGLEQWYRDYMRKKRKRGCTTRSRRRCRSSRCNRTISLAFLLAAACQHAPIAELDASPDVPATARAILEDAESFEILSTETSPAEDEAARSGPHVLSYPILGRAEVASRDRQHAILADLYTAFRENDSKLAMCFQPRHAVVATRGTEQVTLLVCFECMRWCGVGPEGDFSGMMGTSTRDSVNATWRSAGLEIAR